MSGVEIEHIADRLRADYGLARSRLWRRIAKVKRGEHKGKEGVVQSISVSAVGEIVAAVKIDERFGRRVFLPLSDLALGDEARYRPDRRRRRAS